MTTKELFLRDKELPQFWNPIAQDSRFECVCVYARSLLCEEGISAEQMAGAERALQVLRTIAQNEEAGFGFPSPGLIHDMAGPTEPTKTTE